MTGHESDLSTTEARIGQAAEEYFAAVARGAQPSLTEYADRYPEIADDIRRTFPFLMLLGSDGRANSADGVSVLPEAPRTLGDFRIIRELGRGGMGVVHEAEQISTGRRVALKVLMFAAIVDKQQINRFKNEARAAGALDHPNIVAIHSVGCEQGIHYYAMQLIEGQSLAEIIAAMKPGRPKTVQETQPDGALLSDRLSVDTAKAALSTVTTLDSAAFSILPAFGAREYFRAVAKLGIQAAEALDYAHQNGILHRDIKPANLLVDDAGKLWVTDFGLARIEQDAGMTMTGDILGTLRYMSPEQALAKRAVVDHRSDIYSLGVTLYELLTLQPVFTIDDRQELLRQIAFEEPRRPQSINRRIPQDLETIVLKAIEKNPADRYTSARSLADDLNHYLNHGPITAKPPTWMQTVKKWLYRHPVFLWTSAATLFVALLITLVGTALLAEAYSTEAQAREAAEVQSAIAKRERLRAEASLGRNQLESGVSQLNLGNDLGLLDLLDAFETSADVPSQRETCRRFWALGYAMRRYTLEKVFSDGWAGTAYSPDGKLLATVDDENVRLWEISSEKLHAPPMPTGLHAHSLQFSPDGRFVAIHSVVGEARIWNVSTGKPIGSLLKHDSNLHEVDRGQMFSWGASFSPDSKLFATVGADGKVRFWESQTGRASGEPLDSADPTGVGNSIALGLADPAKARSTSTQPLAIVFSPDGRLLAEGTAAGIVRIWDVASRTIRGTSFTYQESGGNLGRVDKVVFSSDGKSLAVIGTSDINYVLDVQTGKEKLHFKTGWIHDMEFSPDGKLIATASHDWSVRLWDAANGQPVGNPMWHHGRAGIVRFSPNGKLLASGSRDRTVRLWRVPSTEAFGSPIYCNSTMNGIAFSPDGESLAIGLDTTLVVGLHHSPVSKPSGKKLEHGVDRLTSSNGKYAASINESSHNVELTETGVNAKPRILNVNRSALAIAFSADSKYLATGSAGHSVTLWETLTGREVNSIQCRERVYGVAFSPDSRLLATALYDGSAVLWNLADKHKRGEPMMHPGPVYGVAFSPDGNLLATTCINAQKRDQPLQVWIWDVSDDAPHLGLALPIAVVDGKRALETFGLTGEIEYNDPDNGRPVNWRLPKLPNNLNEIRLKTWVALCVRREFRGKPANIPVQEWQQLRAELQSLSDK